MALIASIIIITAILALLGSAAQRWGVDSREKTVDTYRPYLGLQ
jgi:hypothetical protein